MKAYSEAPVCPSQHSVGRAPLASKRCAFPSARSLYCCPTVSCYFCCQFIVQRTEGPDPHKMSGLCQDRKSPDLLVCIPETLQLAVSCAWTLSGLENELWSLVFMPWLYCGMSALTLKQEQGREH